MKFDKLKEGMTLYSLTTQKLGNTNMRTKVVHLIHVVSIDREKRTAMCSWNGNRPQVYRERDIERLKESEPILIKSGWGHRLPTREERATILAERKSLAARTNGGGDE